MSYIFSQHLLGTSKYNVKCPYDMNPIGICVHNTSNDASAHNEVKYMVSNNRSTSFHVAIDDKEVIQAIPFNRNAWHAGDGNGNGNRKYIAVEICYSRSGGDRFDKAERNAALWIATELHNRGWGVDRVKRHKDFSGKNCPHRTMELGWQRFLNMIQNELNNINNVHISDNAHSSTTSNSSTVYRVRKSWADASSQIGAYSSFENAKKVCKDGYSVFDDNGNVVYPIATHKYSVGQYVKFTTSYPSSTSPCGIAYATGGGGQGQITAIVNGQAKYQIENGARYCNDGDIQGTYAMESHSVKALSVNTYYRVYANGKWYSEVSNLNDYAGDDKNSIKAIALRVDNGSVKYRVHTKNGKWYPYVTGYNVSDGNNGYAGDCRNDIDAIEIYYTTPSGCVVKKAKYRLAPIRGNYYDWQYDNETTNGQDGYAGNFGTSFGKFQFVVE